MKKDIIIIADYSEDIILNSSELCDIFGIDSSLLSDMVAYDILIPVDNDHDEWVFDMAQLKRLRSALRMQRDLELNLAGVALVLHLLDEMDELRAKAELLNQHLLK